MEVVRPRERRRVEVRRVRASRECGLRLVDRAVDDDDGNAGPRGARRIRVDRLEPPLRGRVTDRDRGGRQGAQRRGDDDRQAAMHARSRVPLRSGAVPRAYVALGSNLGRREATIRAALDVLAAEPGIELVAVSELVDTEPVGYVDQPRFLNGVAAVDTELSARDLLAALLDLERRFGRRRDDATPQGPRTLDLDLVLYGDAEIDEPGLTVPHPRMHERGFVLGPLAELAPGLEVPGKGRVETLMAGVH